MTDQLNKQFFDTQMKHLQNVSPKAWFYVIPIVFFFVALGTYIVDYLPKSKSISPIQNNQSSIIPIDSITAKEIAIEVERGFTANSVIRYRQSEENKMIYNPIDSLVSGIRLDSVNEVTAREMISKYFKRVRSNKNYLYLSNLRFDSDFKSYYDIIVTPIDSQFEVVKQVGTWAPNYDLGNEDIISWLRQRNKEFDFDIIVVDNDRIEAYLNSKPKSIDQLAKQIYTFCPDVIEQGHENMEELIETIDKHNYMWLWWD